MEGTGTTRAEVHAGLPLFALPDYALFPHTLVPFHVFEPRYVAMLDHCLADRRLLVVAGLRPGWEEAAPGRAPVHEVAGLGRVVSDRRLPDGRTNIFVHCVARVRILRRHVGEAWDRVDAVAWPDLGEDPGALAAAAARLGGLGAGLARELGADGAALGKALASTRDAAVLSHRLAAMVVDDPGARQALLAERSALRRCLAVEEHLAAALLEEAGAAREGAGWIN